jgi:hypothetical protein
MNDSADFGWYGKCLPSFESGSNVPCRHEDGFHSPPMPPSLADSMKRLSIFWFYGRYFPFWETALSRSFSYQGYPSVLEPLGKCVMCFDGRSRRVFGSHRDRISSSNTFWDRKFPRSTNRRNDEPERSKPESAWVSTYRNALACKEPSATKANFGFRWPGFTKRAAICSVWPYWQNIEGVRQCLRVSLVIRQASNLTIPLRSPHRINVCQKNENFAFAFAIE